MLYYSLCSKSSPHTHTKFSLFIYYTDHVTDKQTTHKQTNLIKAKAIYTRFSFMCGAYVNVEHQHESLNPRWIKQNNVFPPEGSTVHNFKAFCLSSFFSGVSIEVIHP